MSKINIWQIIADHFRTFRSFKTGKVAVLDYALGLILPVGFAFWLVWSRTINLDKDAIGILATSLSIFAALLFNLLLLIYEIVSREGQSRTTLEKEFLSQIYSNVSYSILISLLAVLLLLVAYFTESLDWWPVLDTLVDGVILSFIGMFLHVLIMVLKRVHGILTQILPARS